MTICTFIQFEWTNVELQKIGKKGGYTHNMSLTEKSRYCGWSRQTFICLVMDRQFLYPTKVDTLVNSWLLSSFSMLNRSLPHCAMNTNEGRAWIFKPLKSSVFTQRYLLLQAQLYCSWKVQRYSISWRHFPEQIHSLTTGLVLIYFVMFKNGAFSSIGHNNISTISCLLSDPEHQRLSQLS